MKRTTIHALALCATLGFGSAIAQEAPVPVNTSALEPGVAEQVRKAANEGMTSLTKYLERTRKENRLTVEDVTRPPVSYDPITDPSKEYKLHANDWKPQRM
jgi:hypothetical protein